VSISTPEFLPNGQSLWIDQDFVRRLHYGDSSIGWNGDLNLGVYHNADRLEIWRLCDDGEMHLVMRSKPGHKTLDTSALVFLAAHDSQRRGGYDVKADVDGTRARIDADKQRVADAKFEEAADKLHYALRRDTGALNGGLTRRQFSFAPRNKKGI
jgi:hypothetical protein